MKNDEGYVLAGVPLPMKGGGAEEEGVDMGPGGTLVLEDPQPGIPARCHLRKLGHLTVQAQRTKEENGFSQVLFNRKHKIYLLRRNRSRLEPGCSKGSRPTARDQRLPDWRREDPGEPGQPSGGAEGLYSGRIEDGAGKGETEGDVPEIPECREWEDSGVPTRTRCRRIYPDPGRVGHHHQVQQGVGETQGGRDGVLRRPAGEVPGGGQILGADQQDPEEDLRQVFLSRGTSGDQPGGLGDQHAAKPHKAVKNQGDASGRQAAGGYGRRRRSISSSCIGSGATSIARPNQIKSGKEDGTFPSQFGTPPLEVERKDGPSPTCSGHMHGSSGQGRG